MRRRILRSTLLAVAVTALVLGAPLALARWQLIEDFHRADLRSDLEQIATTFDGDGNGLVVADQRVVELLVPAGTQLTVEQAGRSPWTVGRDVGPEPVAETHSVGAETQLTLAEPRATLRAVQLEAVLVVLLLAVLSVGTGAAVAVVTARRLAEPLRDVADRAARLGAGDFRATPQRHRIPELDRVSDVLDTSAAALAELVQRERDLVGDVSHQLRSRLTALQLRLDELSTHPDPTARQEALAALEQTERLTAVLDELLSAARAAQSARAEPVDLRAGLGAIVEEWRPALRRTGRTLKVRIPDGLFARVTPARLREAVGALLENALQHGAGPVLLAARATDRGLQIEVGDTGPGVPQELVPHVFDRGVSVRSSTGIGLALARALVEADGGRLELSRARPPVFTIFLPAARSDDVLPLPRPVSTPR